MGFLAPRSVYWTLFAVIALAFGATDAHAVNYNFSVSPDPPNQGQVTTFRLTPTAADFDVVGWDLDVDADQGPVYENGTSRTVTRTYASPGEVTVSMQARETEDDPFQTVTKTLTVNGRPAADFGFTPGAPVAGEPVDFTPVVNDPEDDAVTLAWDFGDGTGSSDGAPTHPFDEEGTYDVELTATDEHGATTSVTHQVVVAKDPGPAPSFGYTPSDPTAGDTVTFTSTSTPSWGSITATEWDFDADGVYEDGGSQAESSFGAGAIQ